MLLVIVTGMSGAGKSTALKFFEDFGFYCVDNLPPSLIVEFAELSLLSGAGIDRVAVGVDIRGGSMFAGLLPVLDVMPDKIQTRVLFLESSNEALTTRYKETRRSHPLAKTGRIIDGIELEREELTEIKKRADIILDTSKLLTRQLKERIEELFVEDKLFNSLVINVMSFGFKVGIPNDADLVFDVRFLPNPFYIPTLKALTGNDVPVSDYVKSQEQFAPFMAKLTDMIDFLIPNFKNEGKTQLVIAIGCTGGKHRSVTIANALFADLTNKGFYTLITHRDIEK